MGYFRHIKSRDLLTVYLQRSTGKRVMISLYHQIRRIPDKFLSKKSHLLDNIVEHIHYWMQFKTKVEYYQALFDIKRAFWFRAMQFIRHWYSNPIKRFANSPFASFNSTLVISPRPSQSVAVGAKLPPSSFQRSNTHAFSIYNAAMKV